MGKSCKAISKKNHQGEASDMTDATYTLFAYVFLILGSMSVAVWTVSTRKYNISLGVGWLLIGLSYGLMAR